MSRFEFNMAGLRELMKSQGMQAKLEEAGSAVANIANGSKAGYKTDTHVAPLTAVCTVYPSDRESGVDNYRHNTLLKAVNGAGLKLKTHPKKG